MAADTETAPDTTTVTVTEKAGGRRKSRIDTVTTRVTLAVLAVLVLAGVAAIVQSGGPAAPGTTPSPTASVPLDRRVPVPTPLAASPITGVDVASIGLDTTQIVSLGLREDETLDVPTDAAHVGWYQRSASPGTVGPAVLAGHVNYHGQDGAFAKLGDAKQGDVIEVHRADGTTAVFEVSQVGEYAKDAFPTDAVYAPTPDPEVRLITCGGVFDPVKRSYEDNIVVFAKLAGAYRAA